MVDDKDTRFRPKLGKIRSRDSRQEKRFINRVLAAATGAGPGWVFGRNGSSRFVSGERIGRGAAAGRLRGVGPDPLKSFRSRRVMVKVRIIKFTGNGFSRAQAHIRYVERDGVGKGDEPGRLYDASGDEVNPGKFMERCEGDRHQFRFIVSAEDAAELEDLKPFVRDLMSKMEEDLGTELDWVAADHFNTNNPHSHVIVRGKDDRGENLVIARDYISHGMRRRASELLTLELGPRTDLVIQNAMRREVTQDRFTSIDRQMVRDAADGLIDVRYKPDDAYGRAKHSARLGRLRKLQRMGLARKTLPGLWQLSDDLESTLRRLSQRGDIIKIMHAEMKRQGIEHGEAEYTIYGPGADRVHRIVGRVVSKGLSDELNDRTYVIVDGVDGKTHYVDIGSDAQADDYRTGAIVEVTPRSVEPREADRVIVEIAEGNEGIYSAEAHERSDPSATSRYIQAHVRRLEALRRAGYVMRMPDGRWSVPGNYLDRAAEYEADRARRQPVSIAVQSRWPLERLVAADGATWLDRQLMTKGGPALAATGFGREAGDALEKRRAHLIGQGFAEEKGRRTVYRRALLRILQEREIAQAGARLADETGLAYQEARDGVQVEGVYRRPVDLASGRYALIEQRSKEFTLVPWRSVLERVRGKVVAGRVRGDTISWNIGRKPGLGI